jgi:hypothetical protein
MPVDYYSGAKIAQPTGKVGGPTIRTPRPSVLPGTGAMTPGSKPSAGTAGSPPSLSSLFAGLGVGGGGGAPGGGTSGNTGVFNPGTGTGSNTPLSLSAPENPRLTGMIGDFAGMKDQYSQYGKDLASASDLSATQAMQRQRDAMSGMAKEYELGASARGIRGSGAAEQDLINKVIKPGQNSITQLNQDLANKGREQQFNTLGGEFNALQGKQGASNSSANWQQSQQNLGLEAWKAQQNNMLAQWQLQNQQQNQGVNQMLALMSSIGNLYSGF